MKAVTLLYHDAAEASDPDASGFPGGGPALYKLPPATLAAHFAALDAAGFRPGSVAPLLDGNAPATATFITFDDGGSSALAPIADLLDARGWVGHFFITSDRIGAPGFLSAAGIRELARRGHVIGSHSRSHPPRMSALTPAQLRAEWADSAAALSDVLGRAVRVASVPGGYSSRAVIEAAAAAGIRALFTSEPVKGVYRAGDCWVFGRYSLLRGDGPERAVALAAAGLSAAQVGQYLAWNVKKAAKVVGGDRYIRLRRYLLRSAAH